MKYTSICQTWHWSLRNVLLLQSVCKPFVPRVITAREHLRRYTPTVAIYLMSFFRTCLLISSSSWLVVCFYLQPLGVLISPTPPTPPPPFSYFCLHGWKGENITFADGTWWWCDYSTPEVRIIFWNMNLIDIREFYQPRRLKYARNNII